jgi:hypothetical protein
MRSSTAELIRNTKPNRRNECSAFRGRRKPRWSSRTPASPHQQTFATTITSSPSGRLSRRQIAVDFGKNRAEGRGRDRAPAVPGDCRMIGWSRPRRLPGILHARAHSQKPDKVYEPVGKLCPAARDELFSRSIREWWDCHGDARCPMTLPTISRSRSTSHPRQSGNTSGGPTRTPKRVAGARPQR